MSRVDNVVSGAMFTLSCLFLAAKMIPLFMVFAGGPVGSGQQWYAIILLHMKISVVTFH